jgi:hypothetical protein
MDLGKKRKTNPENPQNHKENDLEEVPIAVIGHLKEYDLASAERVHGLWMAQLSISAPPLIFELTDSVKVAMSAQRKLRHIVLILKVWLISCVAA